MQMFKKLCQRDEGSIDFVQLVIGLLIISIAAVGTFQALIYGYEQLDYEMRHRKAVSIARSHVEYWQGRIHTDMPTSRQEANGNLNRPNQFLLDERDPNTDIDNIDCWVSYGPLEPIDLPTTGDGVDHFKVRVYVSWWEPEQSRLTKAHEIFFDATMVPAAL